MATTGEGRAVTPTVPVAGTPALPAQAYIPRFNSAERDLEMQSPQGLRSRYRSPPLVDLPAMPAELESTSESEPTMTPTSTIGSAETEVPQTKLSTFEWLGIFLGELIDGLVTPKLPENAVRQADYDRARIKEIKESVNGIPRLAAFQNSGESFFNFRRFGNAATRILLVKQIELHLLVTKLEELDLHDAADYQKWGYRLASVEHHEKWDTAQWDLMQEIESKLNKYYDFYLKFQKIRAFKTTDARDHRKLHDWVIANDPIYEEEREYLFDKADFMSSKKETGKRIVQDSLIVTLLHDLTKKYPHSFLSGFLTERREQENAEGSQAVIHMSEFRFMILTKIIIAALSILVILGAVLAIWLESQLSRGAIGAIVILFGFIFAAAILAVTSTALEIFMGIIGCFAVVASVLANRNQGNGTGPVAE